MDETVLTWSVTNMVTIWLMAIIGALLLMFAAQLWNGGAMKSMQS